MEGTARGKERYKRERSEVMGAEAVAMFAVRIIGWERERGGVFCVRLLKQE